MRNPRARDLQRTAFFAARHSLARRPAGHTREKIAQVAAAAALRDLHAMLLLCRGGVGFFPPSPARPGHLEEKRKKKK